MFVEIADTVEVSAKIGGVVKTWVEIRGVAGASVTGDPR